MKKFIITILAVFSVTGIYAQTYEFKIVTSVESIVPGGLGDLGLLKIMKKEIFLQ